jgi:protein SCO1
MSQQTMVGPQPPSERHSNRLPLLMGAAGVGLVGIGVMLFMIFRMLFPADSSAYYVGLQSLEMAEGGISVITPPRAVADFTLTAQTGEPFTFRDTRGKAVLMVFGYTHCPDVCPMTLMEMDRVRNQLGADADQVEFIFVSVDGGRDTPDWMNKYFETRGINDYYIGLTGTEGEIRRVGADYGLYFSKNTTSGSQAAYLVDHTASSYLIDPEGRLSAILAFGTHPDIITRAVYEVLGER